ncbi:MAG: hypothetical protein AB1921_02405 [Thermodesulfobacteriota bacterium]
MQKALAALFCLWLVLAAGACARGPGRDRAEEVYRLLSGRDRTPCSIRGVGSFRQERGGTSLSGRMAFAAQTPDKFRVELLSPFGLPVVSLASDGGKLTLYSRQDGEFTAAPSGGPVLKKALGILISPEELTFLLCGRMPVVRASRTRLTREGEEEVLTLSDAWGVVRERLWLAPDLSGAVRAEVFSSFGKKEYEVWLTKRTDAPDVIRIEGPDGAGLTLTPGRLLLNQEIAPETFVLEKPAGR